MKLNRDNVTYGIELELGDVDMNKPVPSHWGTSADPDIMNINPPRAVDTNLEVDMHGREFNSHPFRSIDEMVDRCSSLFDYYPEATKCHRQVVHGHISWDGIDENVEDLKSLLNYFTESAPWLLENLWNHDLSLSHPAMNSSARRWLMFDHAYMPEWRKQFCDEATTAEEFKKGHSRVTDGRYLPQTTRRYYINMYPIFKGSKTIEFRMFHPTLSSSEIRTIFEFITEMCHVAMDGNAIPVQEWATKYIGKLPSEHEYDHDLEMVWQLTNTKYNTKEVYVNHRDFLLANGYKSWSELV